MKLELPYTLMTNKEFKEFIAKTITKYELQELTLDIYYNASSELKLLINFDVTRQFKVKAKEFLNLFENDNETYKNLRFHHGGNFWLIVHTEIFLNHAQEVFVNTFDPFKIHDYLLRIDELFKRLENVHFKNSYNLKLELKNMRSYLQSLAEVPEFVKEQIIRICSDTPTLPLQSEDLKLYYYYMEDAKVKFISSKLMIIFKAFKVHEGVSASSNSDAVLLAAPLSVIEYTTSIYGGRGEERIAVEETDDETFYDNLFSLLSSDKDNAFSSFSETIFAARNI